MEQELVQRAGLEFVAIPGGGLHGLAPPAAIRNGFKLMQGLWAALRLERPRAAFVTGGYVSVPVAVACWLRRAPLLLYLPDVEPGRAVRFISHLAARIGVTTEASRRYLPAHKLVVTGYPVRPELIEAARMARAKALAHFRLDANCKTLLVFGGSRGARSLNRAVGAILEQALARWQIIHISGTLDADEAAARRAALPAALQARYRLYSYLHGDEMGLALRAADLALARAGASVLGELPLFGLPAILVPYPFAWRYQKVNADYLVERGAALRLDDERLNELLPVLERTLGDAARLQTMQANMQALAQTDAATRLARELVQLAGQTR